MEINVSGNTGTDLLLLHGIQGTRLAWSEIERNLRHDHRCISPNFDGRGKRRNQYSAAELTLPSFASELHSIIQATASPGFVLMGWSLGVSVILEYLTHYDHDPIGGIVLISGSPALNECHWFNESDPDKLEIEIATREKRLQLSEAAHPGAVAALWSAIKTSNHEGLLASIKLPCLILHGEHDEDCPFEHGLRLKKQLPNARLIPITNGAHSVLHSHPTFVAHSVRDFVQKIAFHGDQTCN